MDIEKILKKTSGYLSKHPAFALSLCYISLCLLGLIYALVACDIFGLNYLIFAHPQDLILLALNFYEFIIIIFAFVLIIAAINIFKKHVYLLSIILLLLLWLPMPFFSKNSIYDSITHGEKFKIYLNKDNTLNRISNNPIGPVCIIASTSSHIAVYCSEFKEKAFLINRNSIISMTKWENGNESQKTILVNEIKDTNIFFRCLIL